MYVGREGHEWPGLKVHRNPLYRVPISALGGHGIGACLIGNARAALEVSIELVKSRSTSYSGAKMRDFPTVQLRIAAAGAKIDAAALFLRNDCLHAQHALEEGRTLDIETKLRYKRNCAAGIRMCVEAVDSLHEMPAPTASTIAIRCSAYSGTCAPRRPLQLQHDAQLPPWGLVALGASTRVRRYDPRLLLRASGLSKRNDTTATRACRNLQERLT